MTNAPTTLTGFASPEWQKSPECEQLMRRVGRMLFDNMNRSERWMADQFFGGPAASEKSRKFLAVLLRKAAGRELADDLRVYFNTLHAGGDLVTQADVSCAIRLIKGE